MISKNKKSHAKNLCEHNNKSKIEKKKEISKTHAKILCVPEFDLDLDETVNEVFFAKE